MTTTIGPLDFFPYPEVRIGQDEMMFQIEKAVEAGQHICSEAPNGFGKTCVALCGVLPWISGKKGKILYCARTHRQLDRVMEELFTISDRIDVSGVSFRGRQHMCLNEFVLENADVVAPISEVCGQLKASRRCVYYENLRKLGTPEELLEEMPGKVLIAPNIIEIGRRRRICPYELAKRLAKVVDVVALSYLYVFDPWIMEAFIPELETPMSRTVLIQDEAHNVPSTALDSASDSLTIGTIRQAMREATTYNDSLSMNFCRAMAKHVLELSSEISENDEIRINPIELYQRILKIANQKEESQILARMREFGSSIRKGLLKAGKFPRSSMHRVAEFMLNWLQCAERVDYVFVLSSSHSKRKSRRISLDMVALDPTSVTEPILALVHSSVAISGTISPLKAYSEMLGFGSDARMSVFHNPFAARNRLGIIVQGLDTSYKNRSEDIFRRMVSHCVAVSHSTPGNTGIFTTSYQIADSLLKMGLEKKLRKRLFVEKPNLKGIENDKLVEKFKARADKGGAVILGVQGGRNSEGGDFPGATMESVVVVGVPYAKPTARINAKISYYDSRFENKGRDYAYVLPAMTRAIQAAGRPVRRLDDKGAIVLLDQRFATNYLQRFMPAWLTEVIQVLPDRPDMIAQHVENFFVS